MNVSTESTESRVIYAADWEKGEQVPTRESLIQLIRELREKLKLSSDGRLASFLMDKDINFDDVTFQINEESRSWIASVKN